MEKGRNVSGNIPSLFLIHFVNLDLEERVYTKSGNKNPARSPPQVHRVSRSEARFGRRQGIHVPSQPETEPAEEHRPRRDGRGSPEHHQGRHRLLPVHGQLQREVGIHKERSLNLYVSDGVTDRN